MTSSLQYLLQDRSDLIWWVKDADKQVIDDKATFEAVLNFGTWSDFQSTINTLGISVAHDLFNEIATSNRSNLKPEVSNYFNLYFSRHDKTSH